MEKEDAIKLVLLLTGIVAVGAYFVLISPSKGINIAMNNSSYSESNSRSR